MDVRTVTAKQDGLGRKFEASDVTQELRQAAIGYAADYVGEFSYMLDMQAKVRKGQAMSDGMIKGVLNVMAADGRKQATAAVPATDRPARHAVPAGRYGIEVDGELVLLRVEEATWMRDAPEGTMVAKFQSAGAEDGDTFWKGFAFIDPNGQPSVWSRMRFAARQAAALDILTTSADVTAYGFLFATSTGRCWRCGTKLEVEASLCAGLGPVCAKKLGVELKKRTAVAV